jgi:hypothetical protein
MRGAGKRRTPRLPSVGAALPLPALGRAPVGAALWGDPLWFAPSVLAGRARAFTRPTGDHKVALLTIVEGSKMRRIRSALGSALVALGAVLAVASAAPSNGAAQDVSRAVAGGSATLRTLAPSEIIMEVRRVGFEPLGRPVQRGPVYIVFALAGNGSDVKLTVDARSGRLLWVADISGPRYGGYYGYPVWPRRVGPLVPPAEIPNMNDVRPDRTATFARPSPPLPRTRPGELTSAANKEPPDQAPAHPEAAAKPPPVAPTMVPVAPLE